MDKIDFNTYAENTWCKGCGNFAMLNAFKDTLNTLVDEGTPKENIVVLVGIGCHGKLSDYINVNTFSSLHGRAIPAAEGIKIANPKLKVIVFAGDGDTYGEGIGHLIYAAKRNIDITVIIHNNRVYGLTTGQYTSTSPKGFKGRSTPEGALDYPLNPLELMMASGSTYLARGTSHGINLLKKIFKEAILHKGFAMVDVLQVCVTYYNLYKYYSERVYELTDHNPNDYSLAMNKIMEWDYNSDDKKIALGTFYKHNEATFEDNFIYKPTDFENNYKEIDNILNLMK
jgi:2-oxoglutarate ferredoxin oxidoreductase subunit beta